MNGHYENVDGHRVWIENTDDGKHDPGDVPVGSETQSTAPDQQTRPGTPADFPLPDFDVHAGHLRRDDTIALHFPADCADQLIRHPLLRGAAGKIRAAQIDVETEAEYDRDQALFRQMGLLR